MVFLVENFLTVFAWKVSKSVNLKFFNWKSLWSKGCGFLKHSLVIFYPLLFGKCRLRLQRKFLNWEHQSSMLSIGITSTSPGKFTFIRQGHSRTENMYTVLIWWPWNRETPGLSYRFGSRPPVYINLIRDPIQRLVSSFYYRLKPLIETTIEEDLTIGPINEYNVHKWRYSKARSLPRNLVNVENLISLFSPFFVWSGSCLFCDSLEAKFFPFVLAKAFCSNNQ